MSAIRQCSCCECSRYKKWNYCCQTSFWKISFYKKFCANAGYRGTFVNDIKNQIFLDVDISEKIKPHSWQNIPWRWVVERTFSCLNLYRRLSKDYEISSTYSTTMIIISHIHTLLCRFWIQILRFVASYDPWVIYESK